MRSKLLIVIFTILVFIGQSVAATAIPCSMTNDMQSQSDMVDHSGHDMDQDISSGDCGLDCNCPMATCLSVVVASNLDLEVEGNLSQKVSSSTVLSVTQTSTFLYRPPITR